MAFTKTYFLCPTTDFVQPPPAGSLRLGSVLRSTSQPQSPLSVANNAPVANENPPVIETDWKKTVSSETGLGLGVYAQFLQVATGGNAFGPQIAGDHSSRTTSQFAFDQMTTLSFDPTPDYIERVVRAPVIQMWLREPKQRFAPIVSLFLVTAMKIVKGAKMKYTTSDGTTLTANVGVDLPQFGVTIGPKGHWRRADEDETEFARDAEFVFAFRVKRLRFGRRLKAEDYNRGAFFAIQGDEPNEQSVLVEDIDGSQDSKAMITQDYMEDGDVYCISS